MVRLSRLSLESEQADYPESDRPERWPAMAVSFAQPMAVLIDEILPAVALGGGPAGLLCVTEGGIPGWFRFDRCLVKFPPDGPWRLLLGWAAKGPK